MDRSANRRRTALVIKFGQIGDVIMAIPGVRLLNEQGYDIHWVCGRAAQSVLECFPWIKVIPVDDKAILLGNSLERVSHILRLWKKVAVRKYDLCAILYYDPRFRWLALPIRAHKRITLTKNLRETVLLAGRHHTDEYARVLLGRRDEQREQSTPPTRPDRLPPSPWSAKRSVRRIAIVPGGTSNVLGQQILRRWPVKRYVDLAQLLLKRGWEVVLLGGPEDTWVRPYFTDLAIQDSIGLLTLPQVISACDSCDALITHDTGPLHLAGLSTTCIVGIFGPTDPSTRVPRRNSVVGIWGGQGFACRPCYDGQQFAPCQFNGCMHQVTPDLVLHELDRLLEEKAAGTPKPWRVASPEGSPITE